MSTKYVSPAVKKSSTGVYIPFCNECYHLTYKNKDEAMANLVDTTLIVREAPWYYVFKESDLREFPRLFWMNNNDMKAKVLVYLHEFRLHEKRKKS